MVDDVYRFGDDAAGTGPRPSNSGEARLLLERADGRFSRRFDLCGPPSRMARPGG